jgi:hypothetical protein
MIQKTAARLSSDVADFYHHEGYSTDDANAINTATFMHLRSVVPEPDAAIVTEYEDGKPALLAVSGDSLVVVTVAPREDENSRTAETEQAVYPLDSERCRLKARAIRFGGSHSWGHTRRTAWHLSVDDFEIEFTGHMNEDGVNDPKEDFARTLGAALGWTFADDEQPALANVA